MAHPLNNILGALLIIIAFSIAYAYLKPHNLHKTRQVSTLLLKVSYLLYLSNINDSCLYITAPQEVLRKSFRDIEFLLFLIVLFAQLSVFSQENLDSSEKKRG